MYNGSDPKHLKRQIKAAKERAERDTLVLMSIMANPSGRDWVHDFLTSCHVFSSSFTSNALTTAFAEGERNVGLQLFLGIVQSCPDQYIQMMREANDRAISDNRSNGPEQSIRRDSTGSIDSPAPADLGDYDPLAGD